MSLSEKDVCVENAFAGWHLADQQKMDDRPFLPETPLGCQLLLVIGSRLGGWERQLWICWERTRLREGDCVFLGKQLLRLEYADLGRGEEE